MVEKGREQDLAVRGYRAIRRFEASNRRFKVRANLTVLTTFQEPDHYESEVIDFQGSKFIRARVFEKILDEEKEASKRDTKPETDILPENYDFELAGTETCGDRKCYKLTIHPRRKSRFLLEGFILVDCEDYGLVRIQGSPSKRLSFWTLRTKIERQYENRAGVWMTTRIGSVSDLVVAGPSTLSITYEYLDVEALPPLGKRRAESVKDP